MPGRRPRAAPPSPDPAEEDEKLYALDRVLEKLVRKLRKGERIPGLGGSARALRRLVEDARKARAEGAGIQGAARWAVECNPEAVAFLRSFPGARSLFEVEYAECRADERNAATPRDAAKARQRMRALHAIGVALGWELAE